MPIFLRKGDERISVSRPEHVRDALAEGYQPESGQIDLVDRQGRPVAVPAGELGLYLDQGFRPPGVGEQFELAEQTRLQEEHGGARETVRAFGEGGLRGLTLGLSDVVQRGLGVDPEDLSARRQANPLASGGGEVVGSVLPAFVTGGTGMASSAGRASQVLARTPAGIATRTAERIAARGAGGGIARRTGAAAAGFGLEGAAFGAGQLLSQITLEETELSAESFLAATGQGALLGAGLGAGFSLVGRGLGAGAGALEGRALRREAAQEAEARAAQEAEDAAFQQRLQETELMAGARTRGAEAARTDEFARREQVRGEQRVALERERAEGRARVEQERRQSRVEQERAKAEGRVQLEQTRAEGRVAQERQRQKTIELRQAIPKRKRTKRAQTKAKQDAKNAQERVTDAGQELQQAAADVIPIAPPDQAQQIQDALAGLSDSQRRLAEWQTDLRRRTGMRTEIVSRDRWVAKRQARWGRAGLTQRGAGEARAVPDSQVERAVERALADDTEFARRAAQAEAGEIERVFGAPATTDPATARAERLRRAAEGQARSLEEGRAKAVRVVPEGDAISRLPGDPEEFARLTREGSERSIAEGNINPLTGRPLRGRPFQRAPARAPEGIPEGIPAHAEGLDEVRAARVGDLVAQSVDDVSVRDNGRADALRKALDEGLDPADLDPIHVALGRDGKLHVQDGIHRLAVLRERRPDALIPVRFEEASRALPDEAITAEGERFHPLTGELLPGQAEDFTAAAQAISEPPQIPDLTDLLEELPDEQLAEAIEVMSGLERSTVELAEAVTPHMEPAQAQRLTDELVQPYRERTQKAANDEIEDLTDQAERLVEPSPTPRRAAAAGQAPSPLGSAMSAIADVGVTLGASSIPVVGPAVAAFLRFRAIRGAIDKATRVVRGPTAELALKSAQVQDRGAEMIGRILRTGERGAVQAAKGSVPTAAQILSRPLYDGGEPQRAPRIRFERDEDRLPILAQRRAQEVATAAQDIDAVKRRVEMNLGFEVEPSLRKQIAEGIARKLQYLDSVAPKDPTPPSLYGSDWQPSEVEAEEFAEHVRHTQNPLAVLQDLESGRVSMEGVEALRQVYPALHAELQDTLVEEVAENPDRVGYEARVNLSLVFELAADPSMRPEYIGTMQQQYQSDREAMQPTPTLQAPVNLDEQEQLQTSRVAARL